MKNDIRTTYYKSFRRMSFEEDALPRFRLRRLRLVPIVMVALFLFFSIVGELVWFWLNILEFGEDLR
jgi:hypothetical protein